MNKILIVDNEKLIRTLYREELTEEGYEVVTLDGGPSLLEVIEQQQPDLIVLDIKLDQCDGLDLLQDIRNSNHDVPVILCTAYTHYKYDPRSIAADHYVVKSSDLKELKIKIKMAMESSDEFPSKVKPYYTQQQMNFL